MTLPQLVAFARTKANFGTLQDYVDFYDRFASFAVPENLQAVIVSQNENHYQFMQFKADGYFSVTRPLNSRLWYPAENADVVRRQFPDLLAKARDIPVNDGASRAIICRSIYTIQQAIGCALDGLPAGQSNTARKISARAPRPALSWASQQRCTSAPPTWSA